jgi:hypothetical protein
MDVPYFGNSISNGEDTITFSFTVDKGDTGAIVMMRQVMRDMLEKVLTGKSPIPPIVESKDLFPAVIPRVGITPGETIGDKARRLRIEAGDGLKDCAVKLGYKRMSYNIISRAKRGTGNATKGVAQRIIDLYSKKG